MYRSKDVLSSENSDRELNTDYFGVVFEQYSDFNSRLNLSSNTESIFKKFDLELSGSREFPTQTVNVFSFNKMFFVGGLIKMNFGKRSLYIMGMGFSYLA